MHRLILSAIAAICVLSCCTAARAQYRDPRPRDSRNDYFTQPRYSPYLDLIQNPATRNATRYHRLVQPRIEFEKAQRQQRQELDRLESNQQQLRYQQQQLTPLGIVPYADPITGAAIGLRPTGHDVNFSSGAGVVQPAPRHINRTHQGQGLRNQYDRLRNQRREPPRTGNYGQANPDTRYVNESTYQRNKGHR